MNQLAQTVSRNRPAATSAGSEARDAAAHGEPETRAAVAAPPEREGHCSPDPLGDTDRYRLVTPYFSSARDL